MEGKSTSDVFTENYLSGEHGNAPDRCDTQEEAENGLPPAETADKTCVKPCDEHISPDGHAPTQTMPDTQAVGPEDLADYHPLPPNSFSAAQDIQADLEDVQVSLERLELNTRTIVESTGTVLEIQTNLNRVQARIEQLEQDTKAIAESSGKTAVEIREMHKLYHTEFANRLVSMQEELEQYREIDKGRIFDGILGEIAKLYSENESIVDEMADEKQKKRLNNMFMDMLEILKMYNVHMQKSVQGDKRNTQHCRVIECIVTDDKAKHDTVIQSRNTGFYVENRTLVKELVDVYIVPKNR